MEPERRRSQLRLTLGLVWIPGLVVLAAALAFSLLSGTGMWTLTQDPTTVLGGDFYVGSLSTLDMILWSATIAICLFVAALPGHGKAAGWRRFLAVSGFFTSVLLIDDAYLVHDEILPHYVGIRGDVLGIGYLIVTLALIIEFRRTIARTNYPLLAIALGLFVISAATDVAHSLLSDLVAPRLVDLVEDGTKLLGIGTWLAYYSSVARLAIDQTPLPVAESSEAEEPIRPVGQDA